MEEQEAYSVRTILVNELNSGIRQLRATSLLFIIGLTLYLIAAIMKYSKRIYIPPWNSYIGFGNPATEATIAIFTGINAGILYLSQTILALSVIRLSNLIKVEQIGMLKIIGLTIFSSVVINFVLAIIYYIILVVDTGFGILTYRFSLSTNYIRGFLFYLIPVIGIFFIGLYFVQLKEINGYQNNIMILPFLPIGLILIWAILVILSYTLPVTIGLAWIVTRIIIECITTAAVIGSFVEFLIKSYDLKPIEIINHRLKLG